MHRNAGPSIAWHDKVHQLLVDEATPDALFIHDHAGRFVDVNRKACESLGYSRDELRRLGVLELEQDFDPLRAQSTWSLIQSGAARQLGGHHRRKDGSIFPVEIHVGLLVDEGQRYYVAVVRNITERVRLNANLQLQAMVFGSAEEGILIADRDAARKVSEVVIAELGNPLRLSGGSEVRIGGSVGIALFPQDGQLAIKLLERADQALYEARRAGGGTFRYFSEDCELRQPA